MRSRSLALVAPFLLLVTGLGCSTHRRPPKGSEPVPGAPCLVWFDRDSTKAERAKLRIAIAGTFRAFAKDWGAPSEPISLFLVKGSGFWSQGDWLSGAYTGLGRISCATGAGSQAERIPALYHELWHPVIGDRHHSDPRWHGPNGIDAQGAGVAASHWP